MICDKMGNYKEQNCQLNPRRRKYGWISPAEEEEDEE